MAAFPRLRLRDPAIDLVDLPWEVPLEDWPADRLAFKFVPVGPSRHLVRFLVSSGTLYALKELPLGVARQEYDVLLHLENLGLPTVEVAGVAETPAREAVVRTHDSLSSAGPLLTVALDAAKFRVPTALLRGLRAAPLHGLPLRW